MNKNGVIAGGNFIIDTVKIIDAYPEQDALANVQSTSSSNGGGPFNVLCDLSNLGAEFPLEAVGLVGKDPISQEVFDICHQKNISTAQLHQTDLADTSFTDVMSVENTGRRTFFHARGANQHLGVEHFNFEATNAKILYIGYLLLLDKLDALKPDGTTEMTALLKQATDAGLLTCIDIVSASSNMFSKIIPPSLPYADVLFINEYEAGKTTGIHATNPNGSVNIEKATQAALALQKMGVRKWVVLHFTEGVVAVNANGQLVKQGSCQIPAEQIKGANGAGDALAAGVMLGLHNDLPIEKCLQMGVCTAAASLRTPTCSDGVKSLDEALSLGQQFGYNSI